MELEDKIKLNLIEDALENYFVCLRLVNSNSEISSRIVFQYLPFLSLNILDIADKFGLSIDENIYYKKNIYNFTKLLNYNRALLKQDTVYNKYSKIKKEILKSLNNNYYLLTKDYNIIQKFIINIIGQKDFAVYSYKGIPFYNNIQNIRFIECFLDSDNNINKGDLIHFSYSIANFLKSIIKDLIDLEAFKYKFEEKIEDKINDFEMNDYYVYETNRADLFVNHLDIDQNIFFFNLICLVNSANFLYPKVFKLGKHPQLRMKFITYLIVVKSLWIYQKKFGNLSKDLKSIIEISDSIFKNEENRRKFRNNIFHYDLPSDAGFEINIINSITKYFLNLSIDEFDSLTSSSLDIFILEANKLLFGEQRKFIGSNC
ncbi:hypothetical protein ANHYDRO_00418 [Anaerococcus hydrogenalis DSM 7454]|uniref:Uncharacterized protein n=1 Tax=Anaerococcus hydrogenalis DSM 7454 TaxID=561177 RepID=B6W772_9FIRM|nr:hypothetical protein [Anaerococcus hydrogenalis]EEB36746.1 hypothetical protein ANHYDRO_00418 [Anaerococcus hydrogenalis DSM 7454]